jgi:hypothetical protein
LKVEVLQIEGLVRSREYSNSNLDFCVRNEFDEISLI